MQEILDFIITALFVAFMVFLILGFNYQMRIKAKEKEEKYKQFNKKEKK
ncbi:hypothetical protein [Campylobacter sp. US33a]|uniref:Small hydrophobic protein n=1 Tax=Campylobacter sp. CCS1377 TaxID=3158229 RepID=A0AAU7E7I0_9BACT|nr:hypothetical protein [Campylobacter sp. US33a]MCW1360602.1 hypothetical protein [Campylobacter jejuni]